MIKEIDDANGNYVTKDIKELILVFDSGLFVHLDQVIAYEELFQNSNYKIQIELAMLNHQIDIDEFIKMNLIGVDMLYVEMSPVKLDFVKCRKSYLCDMVMTDYKISQMNPDVEKLSMTFTGKILTKRRDENE